MANVEKTPAQILRDAAGVIRKRGWCQGAAIDRAGGHCAFAAVSVASDSHDDWDRTLREAALDVLRRFTSGKPVTKWNDDPERTVDEVLVALESAAASLESA